MTQRHQGQRRRHYARRQHEVRERRPEGDGQGWRLNEESLDWGLINLDVEDRRLDGRLGGQSR
jgi:hypothetical protein